MKISPMNEHERRRFPGRAFACVVASVALTAGARATPEVPGLKPGETCKSLPLLAPSGESATLLHPRILHASTSEPLEGVLVELYTEAETEPLRVETRVSRGETGRDGSVRLPFAVAIVRADKVRLSKRGFASTVASVSDLLHDEYRLFPANPLRGRVLEFDGTPVVGALVRTRQTCAHAIPAASTTTDEHGGWTLVDCPPCTDDPELEVVSRAHTPVFQLDVDELRLMQALFGSIDLYVGRANPRSFRLVDATGAAMPGRLVVSTHPPFHPLRSGPSGICELVPSSRAGMFDGRCCDERGKEAIRSAVLPRGLVPSLGLVESVSSRPRDGKLRLAVEAEPPLEAGERGPLIQVFTADGNVLEATGELVLPRGKTLVMIGADFSGWREEAREIEVGATQIEAKFIARREPTLLVRLSAAQCLGLVLQADDDTLFDEAVHASAAEVRPSVPAGRAITVVEIWSKGGLWRATHPGIETDTTLDTSRVGSLLRSRAVMLDPFLPAAPNAPADAAPTLNVSETNMLGEVVPDLRIAIWRWRREMDELGKESWTNNPDEWTGSEVMPPFPQLVRSPLRLDLHAPGYCSAHIETVPAGGALPPIRLARLATLLLVGKDLQAQIGGGEFVATPEGLLVEVAPGPLSVHVVRPGQSSLAFELVLADGEERRIVVP